MKIGLKVNVLEDYMTPNVRHRWRRENIGATKELNLWI